MNRLIRFLKGYIHIRLISNDPERFLNLCAYNGIFLWQLVSRNGFYEMYLSASDFFRLHGICRKSGARVKILKKHGLFFFFYQNRKRKVFFSGSILFPALILGLSLFVWNIHITGNYANSTGNILKFLEANGVRHGILKKNVDCGKIAAMLREEFSNITWVSARLEGTQLILDIKENVDDYTDEKIPDEPTNLIAAKDGIVQSIVTRRGTPMVLPGGVCKKGDVLVSGEIEIKNDNREVTGYHYVAADADIIMETAWYYYDEFPIVYEKRDYLDHTAVFPVLQIGDLRMEGFWPFNRKRTFDEETRLWQLRLTENFVLPVSIGYRKTLPYESEQKKYSLEEVKRLAAERLEYYETKLEKEKIYIKDIDLNTEISGDVCRTKGTMTVLESAVERGICEQKTVIPKEENAEETGE